MQTVSILGCGWLGLPLGEFLLEKGILVKGSTTSPEKLSLLAEKGIQPFLLTLSPEVPDRQHEELREFLKTDILIINIPPRTGSQGHDFHVTQIRQLVSQLDATKTCIIYVSSTSVYPDENQIATELSPVVETNAMVQAEKIVSLQTPKTTILRCGGLMGYNRIPGKYVAGKTINTGDIPVNFVHRDDVVHIIYEIIRQEKWGQTYNVVAPEHPTRKEVYARNAAELGFAPPVYDNTPPPAYKVINGEKLIHELDYTFLFPDPVTFSYQL
jgi:nucleoside-diphosphate-sugar epimerase